MAWLLQACGGADATAPRAGTTSQSTNGDVAPVAGVRTTLQAPALDTVHVGGSITVRGDGLDAAGVAATLGAAELVVAGRSAQTITFNVPVGVLPCSDASTMRLRVRAGAADSSWMVPVRVARRVALHTGDPLQLANDVGGCVELAAADANDADVVLALTNASEHDDASAMARATATNSAPFSGDAHAAHLDHDREQGTALSTTWRALGGAATLRTAAKVVAPAAMGDTLTLRALYTSCSAGRAVRARVVYAGTRALVLEDIAAPRAGTMDSEYRAIGQEFDDVVYPLLTTSLGDPLAMDARLGGDGRVTMLFTRFVNDSLPGTSGYVSACNFQPSSVFPASNARALLYGRVPSAVEAPAEWRRVMRSTVVHEAKHLASYAERVSAGHPFESMWLEEATARVAEELYARRLAQAAWRGHTGYASTVLCELTQCDGRPLVAWKLFSVLHQYVGGADTLSIAGPSGRSDQTWYASGWSLVRWVADHHATDEATWLRTLVRGGTQVGVAHLAAVAGVSSRELLAGWAMSTAASALGVDATDRARATWNVTDVWRGMAATFAGTYTATPLRPTPLGDTAVVRNDLRVRPMGVRYVSVTTGRGRVVSLETSAAVQVSVLRVR